MLQAAGEGVSWLMPGLVPQGGRDLEPTHLVPVRLDLLQPYDAYLCPAAGGTAHQEWSAEALLGPHGRLLAADAWPLASVPAMGLIRPVHTQMY